MQYKIPVQIENDDPIILGLSLKQLIIIMVFFWIAYYVFQSLSRAFGNDIALIPTIIIAFIWIVIAIFKHSEMTFVAFVLAFLSFILRISVRKWMKWIDSYSPLDIWYVISENEKPENKVDFDDKLSKIKELDEKLEKI
jgi:hypothetical protein